MLGKSSKPVIEILTGSLVSGNRAGPVDVATSPINHMEPKTRSHRGLKSFDFGGVGLGIVTALEKSGNNALFGRNLSRSNPIPFKPPNNPSRICRNSEGNVEMESSEEYTIVRCHGPNKSYTKVYPNGVESEQNGDDKIRLRIRSSIKSNRGSVFHISPGKNGEAAEIPSPDFLSACNLCHKELHGKDIYMYRGEKAFCSTECRYRQMAMDERTEKCCSEAVEVAAAGSPCANDRILTAGIMAI